MKSTSKCIFKTLFSCFLLTPTLCSPLLLSPLRSTRLSNALLPNDANGGSNLYPEPDWVRITEAPPRVIQAAVGERLELECEAFGNDPMIQWVRGEEQVTDNDSYESNSIGGLDESDLNRGLSKIRARLVINSVLPPHQGALTCLATSGSKTVAASTALIVMQGKQSGRSNFSALLAALPLAQPRARIVLWSPVQMSLQGSDIAVPCRAIGHPNPQVYWLDNKGEIVDEHDSRIKVLPDGELQIKNLAWGDMGAYTCIARNSFSKDSISTFIYPLSNEN